MNRTLLHTTLMVLNRMCTFFHYALIYVIAGYAVQAYGQFPATIELSNLCGPNGFVINGIDADDQSSNSVCSAGDVNGDGIDDLIIGAQFANPNGNNGAGESYVVFGTTTGFISPLNLSTLNGTNGFVINGIDPFDHSGTSVSGAGDVNGDGIDDLVIGAQGGEPNGNRYSGESYVIYGTSAGFISPLNLSTLNGTNGFVLNGIDPFDFSGTSVSGAGDVNGDGIDDIIIGARTASPNGNSVAGESYVVFGTSAGFTSPLNLSTLNGTNGFVLNGIDPNDGSGVSVSSAGDVNGDGIDDLIIGAKSADPNGNGNAGESYVVFGKSSGFASSLNLSSLNGANGLVINGIDLGDGSSMSLSGAGDVNGDGIDDVIIGARYADPNGNSGAGESYLVFGTSTGFTSPLNLSSLNGNNGFVINGINPNDFLGNSVSGAGDVNGDGIDDLIIGSSQIDANGNWIAGESYVVYGTTGGFTSPLNLTTLNGNNGFVIKGIILSDLSSRSRSGDVSGAGDVNGDGIDDLIIGAGSFDTNGNFDTGKSFVVLGSCGPSLLVNGAGQFIPNCSNNPQIADYTLFVGCNRSFQLDNSTGSADLVISNIVSSSPLFSIGLSGFPITIPAGRTLTLPITFTVTGTGTEVGDITIETNDCNDSSYTFSVQNENINSCQMQCPQNEVINGVVYSDTIPEIVIVEDWITVENTTVNANADLEYYADQFVELNPLFEVELDAVFTVLMVGCTP